MLGEAIAAKAFLLRLAGRQGDAAEVVAAFEEYREYLASVYDRLPEGARQFATAEWHYAFDDHRSPHDAWLGRITVLEDSAGLRRKLRQTAIVARLLGAFHDGWITLRYEGVVDYRLERTSARDPATGEGHGDWLIDEIRLHENGHAIHEVLFTNGRWWIECEDVTYSWTPAAE